MNFQEIEEEAIFTGGTAPAEVPALPKENGIAQIMENGINPMAFKGLAPIQMLAKFRSIFPVEHYNVVGVESFLISQLPKGVILMPQMIQLSQDDLWDESNAREIGLKPGQVMPSSVAIERIAQAAGVKLKKDSEGTIEINKVPHYSIEYVAQMVLPDGSIVQTEPTGKALPVLNGKGNTQAHIRENVDMKARRNAYKHILNLPTSMRRDQALKMWVVFKVVYDPSSAAAREIQNKAESARELLFNHKSNQYEAPPPATKDRPNPEDWEDIFRSSPDLKSDWEMVQRMGYSDFELRGIRSYLGEEHRRREQGAKA